MSLAPQAARAIELAGDLPTGLSPAELRVVYTEQRMKLQGERPPVAQALEIDSPGRVHRGCDRNRFDFLCVVDALYGVPDQRS